MPSDLPQRKARRFLSERLRSQEPFTKQELKTATGWTTGTTFDTYWSKQFKPFVVDVGDGGFRVSEAFRPYTNWKQFQRHVTQKRSVAADYTRVEYNRVIVYEFFMPLTNETALRSTLDALFFRDNVIPKLRALGIPELSNRLPTDVGESDDTYLERVATWVGNHFGGYSIYHVDGRFLAGRMLYRDQAADIEMGGQRYVVDETTAVTRFIFPCEDDNEVSLVKFFFDRLFVRTIIQLVNAEDQIWMVESGMENRVHIWRVEGEEDDGSFDETSLTVDESEEDDDTVDD